MLDKLILCGEINKNTYKHFLIQVICAMLKCGHIFSYITNITNYFHNSNQKCKKKNPSTQTKRGWKTKMR